MACPLPGHNGGCLAWVWTLDTRFYNQLVSDIWLLEVIFSRMSACQKDYIKTTEQIGWMVLGQE